MTNATFRRYFGYSPNPSWPGADTGAIHGPEAHTLPICVDARNKSGHDEKKASRRTRQYVKGKKVGGALLAGTAIVACLAIGAEYAGAFGFRGGGGFGGFHGGGGGFRGGAFGGFRRGSFGGGSRFGDSGFADRSRDAGFGQGGFGSVHSSSNYSDRADSYRQSHPEYQHSASQF